MTTSPVAAYFDGVADVYDQVLPFFASFARQVATALDLPPDAQVLDLAAGRGALSRELVGRAGRVVAVDAAPRMAELLARDLPAVETRVMDAASLDFPDATFDLVVAGFVVHILPDPVAAVAEVRRVLRPGGQLAFTIPGRADGSLDPWPDPLNDLVLEYRKYQVTESGLRPNDADEEALLDRAGFTDVSRQTLEIATEVPTARPTGASPGATASARPLTACLTTSAPSSTTGSSRRSTPPAGPSCAARPRSCGPAAGNPGQPTTARRGPRRARSGGNPASRTGPLRCLRHEGRLRRGSDPGGGCLRPR